MRTARKQFVRSWACGGAQDTREAPSLPAGTSLDCKASEPRSASGREPAVVRAWLSGCGHISRDDGRCWLGQQDRSWSNEPRASAIEELGVQGDLEERV